MILNRDELKGIYYANKEIERLKRRVEELETDVINITDKNNCMPKTYGETTRLIKDIIDTKEILWLRTQSLMINKDMAERYIASIPDILVRLVLAYRYIDNLSWYQVACNIGGNNTEESVKKIAYRYFNKKKDRVI